MSAINFFYNPKDFARDYRYLTRNNKQDIQDYIRDRFSNNADDLKPILSYITSAFIDNVSNVYKNGVIYDGLFDENGKYPAWISDNMIPAKVLCEKYRRLTGQSLLYTYKKKDGTFGFRAYDSSKYYIEYNETTGNIESVILRTGWVYKTNAESVVVYFFYRWADGKIFKQNVETNYSNNEYADSSWDLLDSAQWSEETINIDGEEIPASYEVLPFTLYKAKDTVIPIASTLPDLENELVAGDSYAVLNLIISMLQKMMAEGSMTPEQFDDLAQNYGSLFSLGNVPNGVTFKSVEQGSSNNIMNYKEYFTKIMRTIIQLEGGDPFAFFPDVKVESGKSRELQMQNIEEVRKTFITEYLEVERSHWELLKAMDNSVVIPESIEFKSLEIGMTKLEKQELLDKKLDSYYKAFDRGILTKMELISLCRDLLQVEDVEPENIEKQNAEYKQNNVKMLMGTPQVMEEDDDGIEKD